MKQPKLLPGKKRKLTAYEVRKLTRRRHITWQRLGREYNTHFPYEKSGELPGAGDRIVPNAKDLVESYFNEQDEMNNNAIMENEYYDWFHTPLSGKTTSSIFARVVSRAGAA